MTTKSWETLEGGLVAEVSEPPARAEFNALRTRVRLLERAATDAKEAVVCEQLDRAYQLLDAALRAPAPSKTWRELEALKASWLGDPCWDLEDTPGFEADRGELYAFRLEQQNGSLRESLDAQRSALRALKRLLEDL